MPEVKAKFAALGSDTWPMAPKGLQDRIVSEIAVWAPIVKASGAKVDGLRPHPPEPEPARRPPVLGRPSPRYSC